MCSVSEDAELYDWLRWVEENGTSFLRTIADAAFGADIKHYLLFRPVLVELKKMYPRTGWGMYALSHDQSVVLDRDLDQEKSLASNAVPRPVGNRQRTASGHGTTRPCRHFIIEFLPFMRHGLFSIFRRISHLCDVFLSRS